MSSQSSYSFAAPDLSDDGKRAFRNALGLFATGVAIITARNGAGEDVGLTVNSFASVSLNPPLVLWSIAHSSQHMDVFQEGSPYAAHILASDQEALARHFGRPGVDRFAAIEPELEIGRGPDGVPMLGGALAVFDCVVDQVIPGGDHNILLSRVVRFAAPGGAPLTFFAGKLGAA